MASTLFFATFISLSLRSYMETEIKKKKHLAHLFKVLGKPDGTHARSTTYIHGHVKVRVGPLAVVHYCLKQLVSITRSAVSIGFRLVDVNIHLGFVNYV